GLFEGSTEEHGGPGVLLPPAVEIAMLVASRAGKVLADLGVAIDHDATLELLSLTGGAAESSSHWLAGAKPSRLSREVPCMTVWLIFTKPPSPTRTFSLFFIPPDTLC